MTALTRARLYVAAGIFVAGALAVSLQGIARAQQPRMPVVGFLNAGSPDGYAVYVTGFLQGSMKAVTSKVKTSRWITSGLGVSTIASK